MDPWAVWVLLDLEERMARQALRERRDLQGLRALKGLLVRPGRKAFRALKAPKDLPALRARSTLIACTSAVRRRPSLRAKIVR